MGFGTKILSFIRGIFLLPLMLHEEYLILIYKIRRKFPLIKLNIWKGMQAIAEILV